MPSIIYKLRVILLWCSSIFTLYCNKWLIIAPKLSHFIYLGRKSTHFKFRRFINHRAVSSLIMWCIGIRRKEKKCLVITQSYRCADVFQVAFSHSQNTPELVVSCLFFHTFKLKINYTKKKQININEQLNLKIIGEKGKTSKRIFMFH